MALDIYNAVYFLSSFFFIFFYSDMLVKKLWIVSIAIKIDGKGIVF